MPVHPDVAARFSRLNGLYSPQEAYGTAAGRARIRQYESWEPADGPPAAAALALAGVDVRMVRVRGLQHRFLNLPAEAEPVARCLDLMAEVVAAAPGRQRPAGREDER